MTALAALALLAWLALAVAGARARSGLDRLADAPDPTSLDDRGGGPRVSVVVPCRDEATSVEPALRSLLAQRGVRVEVVAVDDRSGDGTGEILDRLAREEPRVVAVHVVALPEGWLGKNHACEVGGRKATGDWILFSDADVVVEPGTLVRAVAYAERHALGHLVAFPSLVATGLLERAYVTAFSTLFGLAVRPDALRRAGTRAFAGSGAFNLVRADAWRAIGGHRRLALEVADDVKLGLVLRRSGFAQGAVDAADLLSVRWYAGLRAALRGLVKNAFAGCEYRWSTVAAVTAGLLLLGPVPALAALVGPPPARLLGLAALAVAAVAHGAGARRFARGSGAEGVLFAPCTLALAAVVVGSAAVATLRSAVVWRETRYPLRALRAGCVRERDWPASRAVGWT